MKGDLENSESWYKGWSEARYTPDFKKQLVSTNGLLYQIIQEGGFGNVIVNVGSGAFDPLTNRLANQQRQIINVDIASNEEHKRRTVLPLRFDIEDLASKEKKSTRLALAKVSRFLKLDNEPQTSNHTVDSFIFSEILNYVDYKSVLEACSHYLKVGGVFLVINEPERGYSALMSDKRPLVNSDIIEALKRLGFNIDLERYHQRIKTLGVTKEEKMMVLVARKE